jgi:Mg2+/citrate symporter
VIGEHKDHNITYVRNRDREARHARHFQLSRSQPGLVPAILLLVTLAGVSLADHHRKVLWRAALVSLSMLTVGVLLGQIPF